MKTAVGEPSPDWERITEADVGDGLSPWSEYDAAEARHDLEYAREVEECCGGRSWYCAHYGASPRHYRLLDNR